MNKVRVLGVLIDSVSMDEAVCQITEFVERKRPHLVVTANPEMVMGARSDQLLEEILERAQLVVADGIGVVWASRVLGQGVPERVPGIELMESVLARAAELGWRVFLLGGEKGVAEKASAAMKKAFPGLNVVGTHHGFFKPGHEERALLHQIKESNPQILLVALGVPRQEKWAAAHLAELGVPVAMGVGGSFNVWAGLDKRAPRWVREMNLEWLYRLIRQPWRIRRVMVLPKFVITVLAERFSQKGTASQ